MIIKQIKKIYQIFKTSYQAFSGYHFQILLLAIFSFFSGFLEAIGISTIIPLFASITGTTGELDDNISLYMKKLFTFFHVDFSLKYFLILICLLFIIKFFTSVITSFIRLKITANYENNTRKQLLKKTINADWLHLLEQKAGHLETILLIDTQRCALLLEQFSSIILIFVNLIIYAIVAFVISSYITVLTLILGGIIFIAFKPFVAKQRLYSKETVRMNKVIANYISEHIAGIKTVKALSAGQIILKKGKEYFDYIRKLSIRMSIVSSLVKNIMQPISIIFIVVLFAISYKTSNFNFAVFAAVIYLSQKIFSFIEQLQSNLHKIIIFYPHLESILKYSSELIEVKEDNHLHRPFNFNKSLSFKQVNFSYSNNRQVISDISFDIRKGQMIGIIGPSGAGKTTLVDIILRLIKPQQGRILLDEEDVSQISLKAWRKNIGYVSQDVLLINNTIENNIKFYNNDISDSDVIEAAKTANIYETINKLPDGFNSMVGERGMKLSVGQRQRIALARVLARKPQILVLDEATSALDIESEIVIQKSIEKLRKEITIIVIAHRLSTIQSCDDLIVISDGKIVEQGPTKVLLDNKKSYFYKVYNLNNF